MLEKPFTATDVKCIDNMLYADTDIRKAMKTKLNSLYGRAVMMNNYIVIHVSNKPIIIFKEHIVSIEKGERDNAIIQTDVGLIFDVDEDYAKVAKLML